MARNDRIEGIKTTRDILPSHLDGGTAGYRILKRWGGDNALRSSRLVLARCRGRIYARLTSGRVVESVARPGAFDHGGLLIGPSKLKFLARTMLRLGWSRGRQGLNRRALQALTIDCRLGLLTQIPPLEHVLSGLDSSPANGCRWRHLADESPTAALSLAACFSDCVGTCPNCGIIDRRGVPCITTATTTTTTTTTDTNTTTATTPVDLVPSRRMLRLFRGLVGCAVRSVGVVRPGALVCGPLCL